jgi:hypothetical protein
VAWITFPFVQEEIVYFRRHRKWFNVSGALEIARFFKTDEILEYKKLGEEVVYSDLFE